MPDIPLKPFPHGKPFKETAGSPLEVLERTRVVLSPRGAWKKGNFKGENGSRCLLQAINDSDGTHAKVARELVMAEIKKLWPHKRYTDIPVFNDATPTQKHHVIAVLDQAIETARKEKK